MVNQELVDSQLWLAVISGYSVIASHCLSALWFAVTLLPGPLGWSGPYFGLHPPTAWPPLMQRVSFQVLNVPISALASYLDAIAEAGTTNGFPGHSVLALTVAEPSPSPSPSASADASPVSPNPNAADPSASPRPVPSPASDPSPSPDPEAPVPEEDSKSPTVIIIIIVTVAVVLVGAVGLAVAFYYRRHRGELLADRPPSRSSLRSAGSSVITVKTQGMCVRMVFKHENFFRRQRTWNCCILVAVGFTGRGRGGWVGGGGAGWDSGEGGAAGWGGVRPSVVTSGSIF